MGLDITSASPADFNLQAITGRDATLDAVSATGPKFQCNLSRQLADPLLEASSYSSRLII